MCIKIYIILELICLLTGSFTLFYGLLKLMGDVIIPYMNDLYITDKKLKTYKYVSFIIFGVLILLLAYLFNVIHGLEAPYSDYILKQ